MKNYSHRSAPLQRAPASLSDFSAKLSRLADRQEAEHPKDAAVFALQACATEQAAQDLRTNSGRWVEISSESDPIIHDLLSLVKPGNAEIIAAGIDRFVFTRGELEPLSEKFYQACELADTYLHLLIRQNTELSEDTSAPADPQANVRFDHETKVLTTFRDSLSSSLLDLTKFVDKKAQIGLEIQTAFEPVKKVLGEGTEVLIANIVESLVTDDSWISDHRQQLMASRGFCRIKQIDPQELEKERERKQAEIAAREAQRVQNQTEQLRLIQLAVEQTQKHSHLHEMSR